MVDERKGQDNNLVSAGVVGVSLDDGLAGALELHVSIMNGREDEGVESEHNTDVDKQPPDEDVGSGRSVGLLEDLLSLLVINNNIHSLGRVGWSVTPGNVIKVADGVDSNHNVPPEVGEIVSWETNNVLSEIFKGIEWSVDEWAKDDSPHQDELENKYVEVSFLVIHTEVLNHVVGTNLTEESVELEEDKDNSEVGHGVLKLGTEGGEDGKHHEDKQGKVNSGGETHGGWVVGEVFIEFVVFSFVVISVEVGIGGVDEQIFHLGEHDSWGNPSHSLVHEQDWDIQKHLQSLGDRMGLSIESKDVVGVQESSELTEQETIGPSSSLLEEDEESLWCISVSWGIHNEIGSVTCSLLIVDVIGQKSIFDQILVGFPTGWLLLQVNELEESLEWFSL